MKIVITGLAVMLFCFSVCYAQYGSDSSRVQVYDGNDTFMGKPLPGATPTTVIEQKGNTIGVYDGNDTFMGKPLPGATPTGVIEQNGNTIGVYDGKDTFMGKPLPGAQPVRVYQTGN